MSCRTYARTINQRRLERETAPYFRNPVSNIFVRMTSATGAVVLGLVEGAASIQSPFESSMAKGKILFLRRPTSTTKDL